MWSEIVEYLKDASLVAKIQDFFGVKIHRKRNFKDHEENSINETREIASSAFEHDLTSCTHESGQLKENGHVPLLRKSVNAAGTSASNDESEDLLSVSDNSNYTITNYFWYYLFLFGTQLGDEIFYSTFIPFWFWNIDGAVGRRVVLMWAIIITTGQILKDVIRWPRPACPPAIRLQTKWSEEYGMPSTHAMVGVSIPFSVVLFTMNRYIYPFSIGWIIAFLWCTIVCMSRLYLGMHTVLDILAGLILAVVLMILLTPLVDVIDYYLISNVWALATLTAISIVVIAYYPTSNKWTPTRGDTSMVVSVTTGVNVGTWLNYKTGAMITPIKMPPYYIVWPSNAMLGCMILRTMLGFVSILLIRTVGKFLSYGAICAILKVNTRDLMKSQNYSENKNKVFADLVYRYATCFMIGVNTVYLLPIIFIMLGIERPTFYKDI